MDEYLIDAKVEHKLWKKEYPNYVFLGGYDNERSIRNI